ncbi:MAG: LLM class F420-dependent oxidoreductase [Chloroflexi bacterium]|nr:MAG: LLM class F420-dependent oxidoreductase [Chloroflexota bacterium]
MKIGLVFPQTEIGNDPTVIRDYAQTAESLGFTHVLAYEHVLGANPDRPNWHGPYNYTHSFHEPFVLFSFMAAVTTRLEFVTGILILPQRQTALVAKQAATLDVLSHGRLRLGVGVGWNPVEFVALNEAFHNRGRRIEEQITLLRQLWTQPLVNFSGQWHTIPDAGLNPLPVQQPIPIWFGGNADVVLARAARLGDGWMPNYRRVEDALPALEKLRGFLAENGRSPHTFGLEARVSWYPDNPDKTRQQITAWQAAGATHISINTMRRGLDTPHKHLNALPTIAALLA